ncbi:unannotated protein [freshwater metagenome]|uniref:Unannotated protein n=1 Tax=freshwater metagenome TaxID=449393 RepID=A0A6J6PCR8_9ZZZZ
MLHVRFAGGDEHVNAATLCRLDGFPTTIDIAQRRTRQTTNHWSAHGLRDGLHGLEVALAGDRETSLDDIDAKTSELLRDFNLLALIKRDSRRLFAVTKGRVENDDPVVVCGGVGGGTHNGAFRGMCCIVGIKRKLAGERKNLPARGRRRLAGAICGTRLTK